MEDVVQRTMDPDVQDAYDSLTPSQRDCLLAVRDVVLDVAETNPDIGPLTETLKWSQPSFLTEQTRSGTTVRLGRIDTDRVAVLVNCQTSLVQEWREIFPHLDFSGTRALVLDPDQPLPVAELEHCIGQALTYKMRKR